MKKKLYLYLLIFIMSCVYTALALPVSHALDSYCTMCHGYYDTAIWFLQNGRIFSYIFYLLFDIIKISYDTLGIISVLIGNAILSYAICILYNELKKHHKSFTKLHRSILVVALFCLFYNPLYPSILVLDEAFIIDLGILFMTIAAIQLVKNNTKGYITSLIFTVLGLACYQGIASYLPIILFILIISDKSKQNNYKFVFKRTILAILNYGIAFVSSYAIIKIVNMMLKTRAPKLGNFDIISNLMHIVTNLLPVSLIFLFRYVGSIYYYFITFILFICVAMCIIKNNNQKYNILLLVLLIGSCVLVPFIPNIFMNSNGNYTDARMALTLGTIPVILIIYLILNYKISTRMLAVIGIMCGLFAMLTFYSVNKSMKTDLKRYEEDIKYIDTVKSSIKNYEENSNITINTIYYAPDLWQAYYYEFGNSNSSNIRLLAVDWAFECAMKAYINREIKIEKMPYDKYQEYFNNQEYGEFSNEELVYDNDKLYLLLY